MIDDWPADRFARRHVAEVSTSDPSFCRCGLGLEAYVHTDTSRYVEVPLTRRVWDELRGGS